MKLFLASEAKHPDTIKKLSEYVDGLAGKKIAYIPTAANAEGWESWKEGGSWKLLHTLKAEITLVQLEEETNPSVRSKLANQDIIWFGGGYCGYLMYWIRHRQIDTYLPELLKKSLYVGSSAGSMITAHSLKTAEWGFVDAEYGAHLIPGLGYTDFDIFPHYQEDQLNLIKQNYKGSKLYLLKNGEEIIYEDGLVTLVGKERIITC
ncbi:MAG: putative peptidase [Microgenomates bacterium OLB23]|nr:MAG: putative peptidase [Microgenomates bacterium OLB23]